MFELDRQGLWGCWQLEDDSIVLVDLTDVPYLNINTNR